MRQWEWRELIQIGEGNFYAGASGKIAVFQPRISFTLLVTTSSTFFTAHHILLTFTPVCSSDIIAIPLTTTSSNASRVNSILISKTPIRFNVCPSSLYSTNVLPFASANLMKLVSNRPPFHGLLTCLLLQQTCPRTADRIARLSLLKKPPSLFRVTASEEEEGGSARVMVEAVERPNLLVR